MPLKEIHDDSMESLGKEPPSYCSEKMCSRDREIVENDGRSGHPKNAIAVENVKVLTLVMCVRRRDLRSIGSEVGISIGVVQLILTDILCQSFQQDGCREC